MSLSAHQLHLLMPEISELVGGVLRHVWSRSAQCLVLEARLPGKNHWLLLSTEPGAVRAHLVTGKPAQPPSPAHFVMLLRKWVTGARVLSASQPDDDRILRLDLNTSDPDAPDIPDTPRPRRHVTLIAELIPARANLYLVDDKGLLLGSLHPGRSTTQVGEAYQPPPPVPSQRKAHDPLKLAALPTDGARSAAVHASTHIRLAAHRFQEAKQALMGRLNKRRKALQRRLKAVTADMERAEEASTFRKYGELLQGAWGTIERGVESAEVPDYYTEGMPTLTIPLDPRRDLKQNIEHYFKRYRKFHDAEDLILERLEQSEARLQQILACIEEAHTLLQPAHDHPTPETHEELAGALEAMLQDLEQRRILPPLKQRQNQGHQKQARLPYHAFEDRKGRQILVGRGGKDNDAVSLKIARGNDLWLHAHNWAGAHVIVRMKRNEDLDQDSLLDAAMLAAWFSKGKKDTLVEVRYTQAKNIRKPKGFPPGRVTVAGGKTLAVRIDHDRLTRLLGKEPKL